MGRIFPSVGQLCRFCDASCDYDWWNLNEQSKVSKKYEYIKTFNIKLECGPMPNVIVALPNISGALCSTPQILARAHCSTAVQ